MTGENNLENQGLVIRPFFGLVNVKPSRTWVVHEPEFESQRTKLMEFYARERGYMPGGFSIQWWGEECMGQHYWDDVIPLAASFLSALEELKKKGQASFMMPDQPVTISFDRIPTPNQLRVRIQDRTVLVCDETDFVNKMTDAVARLRHFLGIR